MDQIDFFAQILWIFFLFAVYKDLLIQGLDFRSEWIAILPDFPCDVLLIVVMLHLKLMQGQS